MNYINILELMEGGKEYTARDLGVAPATMTAMVNRNMVEKIVGRPCRYRKAESNCMQRLDSLLRSNGSEYFVVWLKGKEIGMMCRYKNGILYNCWDEKWNEFVSSIQYIKLFNHSNRIDFMKQ